MAEPKYEMGMIGLGVMGRNFALNIRDHGFGVTGYDREAEKVAALQSESGGENIRGADTPAAMVSLLRKPCAVMLLVPAGPPVDAVIQALLPLLEPGDLIVDGGNSYFKDTDLRQKTLAERGFSINVVDLMKLQPQSEHPHGLSDVDFDELFTMDKPVIFAFHAYPWLIHRLTYRRHNHDNILVRGYKEEGTITTAFDMTVLNDLDRFHLVMDAIDRLPQTGDRGVYLKQQLKDKLVEHKQYIDTYGEDMPEIRNWKWSQNGT